MSEYTLPHRHSLQFNLKQDDPYEKEELALAQDTPSSLPTVCGLPLKYVSLVTLAVQNATLTLIMHYSRVSAPPSQTYSAAAAVLLTELLKGSVSLLVAFTRIDAPAQYPGLAPVSQWSPWALLVRTRRLLREVFRADAWKLSIPAILYVIQNNLQFVAVSNLDAATFQVSYQMKILTTAAFSVLLLRRKLSPTKWLALLFLAIGVGIVQIQGGSSPTTKSLHDMNAVKGFVAVVAACFTSGLAGVYFEMVLKNSQADLWVRNVQLSLFSLLPALAAILFAGPPAAVAGPLGWFNTSIFANFGVWAWATVLIQVLGGLLTALVIKYADNILKGFATSLSIVISFMVSVALFNFHMTLTFILGSTIVLVATWMYNQPDRAITMGLSDDRSWSWQWKTTHSRSVPVDLIGNALSRRASTTSLSSVSSFSTPVHSKSYPPSPIERSSPNLQFLDNGAHGKHSRFFSFAPAKAARFFVSRMGLTRSASFGGVGANANVPNADYGLPQFSFSSSTTSSHTPQPLLGSSLSSSGYTPIMSRPTSAMSSFSSAGPSSLSSSTLSESRISS